MTAAATAASRRPTPSSSTTHGSRIAKGVTGSNTGQLENLLQHGQQTSFAIQEVDEEDEGSSSSNKKSSSPSAETQRMQQDEATTSTNNHTLQNANDEYSDGASKAAGKVFSITKEETILQEKSSMEGSKSVTTTTVRFEDVSNFDKTLAFSPSASVKSVVTPSTGQISGKESQPVNTFETVEANDIRLEKQTGNVTTKSGEVAGYKNLQVEGVSMSASSRKGSLQVNTETCQGIQTESSESESRAKEASGEEDLEGNRIEKYFDITSKTSKTSQERKSSSGKMQTKGEKEEGWKRTNRIHSTDSTKGSMMENSKKEETNSVSVRQSGRLVELVEKEERITEDNTTRIKDDCGGMKFLSKKVDSSQEQDEGGGEKMNITSILSDFVKIETKSAEEDITEKRQGEQEDKDKEHECSNPAHGPTDLMSPRSSFWATSSSFSDLRGQREIDISIRGKGVGKEHPTDEPEDGKATWTTKATITTAIRVEEQQLQKERKRSEGQVKSKTKTNEDTMSPTTSNTNTTVGGMDISLTDPIRLASSCPFPLASSSSSHLPYQEKEKENAQSRHSLINSHHPEQMHQFLSANPARTKITDKDDDARQGEKEPVNVMSSSCRDNDQETEKTPLQLFQTPSVTLPSSQLNTTTSRYSTIIVDDEFQSPSSRECPQVLEQPREEHVEVHEHTFRRSHRRLHDNSGDNNLVFKNSEDEASGKTNSNNNNDDTEEDIEVVVVVVDDETKEENTTRFRSHGVKCTAKQDYFVVYFE